MKELVINHYGTNYHLLVNEVYTGDSLRRYEVTAGEKIISLQRLTGEKRFEKRWKILSINWPIKDKKAAAQFINEIMSKIDEDVDGAKVSVRKTAGK